MKEYIIKVDGQYWCGDSEEAYGHVVSGGFFSMCPNGNMQYKPKFSVNKEDARTVLDPASELQNLLRKMRYWDKVEIERIR